MATKKDEEKMERMAAQIMGINLVLTAICHELNDSQRSKIIKHYDAFRNSLTASLLAEDVPESFLDRVTEYLEIKRKMLLKQS